VEEVDECGVGKQRGSGGVEVARPRAEEGDVEDGAVVDEYPGAGSSVGREDPADGVEVDVRAAEDEGASQRCSQRSPSGSSTAGADTLSRMPQALRYCADAHQVAPMPIRAAGMRMARVIP